MAIVVRHTPQGMTKEQYDKASAKIEESLEWPPDGLDHHICFGDDGDLKVSEIWDSREQFEAFGEKLMPLLGEAGIEFSGEPQVFEVHSTERR